jgi:hypothetical protein
MFKYNIPEVEIPENEILRLEKEAKEIFGIYATGYRLRECVEILYEIEKKKEYKPYTFQPVY